MSTDIRLGTIRTKLFYGLLDYTKSFPDFCIPQEFLMASPKEGKGLLENINHSLKEEPEILLYIHLPFCFSECVFCNAFPQKASRDLQEKYLNGLLAEIELYSQSGTFAGKKVKCIYLGGGTPTTFSTADIQRIIRKTESCVELSADCSITSEAHPKDLLNQRRVAALSELGINRISLGCQTFDPRVLELCRRSSSEPQVREVIGSAREAGLSTNIDMMLGLPGQTLDGVRRDLDILSDLRPDSIEYMRHEIVNPLAISLYRNDPQLLVRNDELFWMVYHTQEWMGQQGYEQNGWFESDKHFPYRYRWLEEMPFIALGSRSRSYTKTMCYDKHEDLSLYLQIINKGMFPIARYVALNKRAQMYRSLFLGLQLKRGLNLRSFHSRFGESALAVFAPLLERLIEYGCISTDDSSISLSKYGRYFVEDVCCLIIDHALDEGGYDSPLGRIPHSSGGLFSALRSRLELPRIG